MEFINDIDINICSNIYIDLKNKIKLLKKVKKPLLIKINSHPCSGKSTFIKKNKETYPKIKLYDMDDQIDIQKRKSFLILEKKENSILFGAIEKERFVDIVYIYVMPKLNDLYKNIVHRQLQRNSCEGWAEASKIIQSRNRLYTTIIRKEDNKQIKPLFYSFKEALDFCIDAYNE